jgi:hypothetical protein
MAVTEVALLRGGAPVSIFRRAPRRPIVLGLIAAFSVALLPGAPIQPARAATAELFFSEYIEGSSNNKALEIFNGTGVAVDLAAAGYNVQMFFNGNPVSTLTINLTGTVADGDVFVLAQTNANATIQAQADQTNGSGWFNGDDAVALRKGTDIIDSIGQIGFDPGSQWGTGLTSTADNTLRRKATIVAGDTDGSDAFDPSVEWDGFATDTFDGLGAHAIIEGDAGPTVSSTDPSDNASGVAPNANISITFSEAVDVVDPWFTIECAVSGSHAPTVSGGPITFTLDPITDFSAGESCTVTIVAANVTDQDADDPPDAMAADSVFTFLVDGSCGDAFTPIPQIQGNGLAAAVTGVVATEGVVVGDFDGPTSVGIQGFYLQDATGDGDTTTSDGIFVFTGNSLVVDEGDLVRVTGFARERFDQTTINGSNGNFAATTQIDLCGSGGTVDPVDVTLPVTSSTSFEPYEGMLVRFPQSLVISEYFNYERFGELVLAKPLPGEDRVFTPTSIVEPGAPAIERALANSLSRITLDDAIGMQNPPSVRHPNGDPFSLANRFRGGDTVQDAIGVLGFDFSLYRIFATAPAVYTSVNPRPVAPDPVGGTLRAATMNALNFFVTLDYPSGDALDNKCGPANTLECRGADFIEPLEFTRQRDKLLAALVGLDADIVGLNEIENSTGADPLGSVVAGLNDILGAGTYDYIDTGVIGTDAIRVGLIYRPATVQPVGDFEVLDSTVDERFIDTRSRPVLAQTFEEVATGARITVAVNHLKSKGSACVGDPLDDEDLGDGQGNCNLTRKAAAEALVDWLATDPTGSGDRDYLILGDLNSYAQEDPIDAILAGPDDTAGTADDYTNLIAQYQGLHAYSFVFDGQSGYLDHALASPTLLSQVTGAAEWHINADEPDLLDYDTSFKPPEQEAIYEPNAYRSSDHDPVVVGLDLRNYEFDGFFRPVDNPPAVNSVNPGQSVPFKFTLAGGLGLDILFGTPTSTPYDCSTGLPTGPAEPTATADDLGLLLDAGTGVYTWTWKTARSWSNQCRTFNLTLDDGSFRSADFQFRK